MGRYGTVESRYACRFCSSNMIVGTQTKPNQIFLGTMLGTTIWTYRRKSKNADFLFFLVIWFLWLCVCVVGVAF